MRPSSLQVTCVGHIIGAVVADTQLHAQRAAKAVKIQYEELKPIVTIQVRAGNDLWQYKEKSRLLINKLV